MCGILENPFETACSPPLLLLPPSASCKGRIEGFLTHGSPVLVVLLAFFARNRNPCNPRLVASGLYQTPHW
jgi:hypothetical protein